MRLRTAAKMMALNHALKSLTLAHADDIDKLLAVKNVDQDPVACLHRTIALGLLFYFNRNFSDKFHRWHIVFAEVALHGLGQPRLFYEFHQANLRRVISI